MKRFTALIATAALIIALFPLYATAAGITKYYITDDIVVTIDTAGGVLTVSGTGAMPDYSKASGTPWYANGSVKRVVVKDGITSVGNRAFSGNSATIDVELGESVERIGTSAFSNCKNLLSVTLPKSLKTIESFAFSNCTSLEAVSFPDSLRSIGDSAFDSCSALAAPRLPEKLEYLDAAAFLSTKFYKALPSGVNLLDGYTLQIKGTVPSSVKIPDGARVLSANTLSASSAVKELTLPDTLERICDFALYNLTKLKSVTVPDSVVSIGSFALGYVKDSVYPAPIADKEFTITSRGGTAAADYADECGFDFVCRCEEGGYISYPDCLEGGDATIGCRYCGKALRTEHVAPRGAHSFGETVVTPASCTESGTSRRECTLCGKVDFTVTTPPTGHVYNAAFPEVENPGCTTYGRVFYKCSVCEEECGESYLISPKGHVAGDERVVLEASCTESGASAIFCKVCGEELERHEIPATGHTTDRKSWRTLIFPEHANGYRCFKVNVCYTCGVAASYIDYLAGDVDRNGALNATDLAALKLAIVGKLPPSCDIEACDVNGDGFINAHDVATIKLTFVS